MTSSADILPPLASVPAHLDNDTVTELTRWVAQQRRKKAVRFVLGQRVGGEQHSLQPVNEWTTEEFEDDREMAEAIYGTAVHEAQALKTSLAYGVFSARPDRPENIGRWFFRVEAGHGWMSSQQTSDSVERSILGMLMGHADAAARLSLGNSHDVIGHHERLQEQTVAHYTRLLDQAYARITVLEAREAEALVSRDQLRTDARDRELELAKENNKTKERLAGMDKIAQLAPLVIAKFGRGSGVELSPSENAAGALDLLQQLLESIDGEQFQHLLMILRPQQHQILELLHDIVQRRKKQQESARLTPAEAPTTPAPTPETSAEAPAPAEAATPTPTEKTPPNASPTEKS